ncbi:hypothetical protein M433DRAFT_288960, partial [Acidomyces richmondensis BFW]
RNFIRFQNLASHEEKRSSTIIRLVDFAACRRGYRTITPSHDFVALARIAVWGGVVLCSGREKEGRSSGFATGKPFPFPSPPTSPVCGDWLGDGLETEVPQLPPDFGVRRCTSPWPGHIPRRMLPLTSHDDRDNAGDDAGDDDDDHHHRHGYWTYRNCHMWLCTPIAAILAKVCVV